MSYRTDYDLTIDTAEPILQEVAGRVARMEQGTMPGRPGMVELVKTYEAILDSRCPASWYDHEEQMGRVSREWPDTLFTLRGTGEDPGDQWVKYFKNGRMQEHRAEHWEPQAFDPALLR